MDTRLDEKKAYQELNKLEGELDGYKKALLQRRVEAEKKQTNAVPTPAASPVAKIVEPKPILEEKPVTKETISSAAIDRRLEELKRKMDSLEKQMDEFEEIKAKLALLDDMDEQISAMQALINEKLNIDFVAMYNNVIDQMNIEAIKIYRNIQAVIVEEDAKQNHVLFGVDGKSDKLKGRMNHVMVFSIVSFVVSILVMIVQILPRLGIDLF